jgi:hypothetical protein
MHQTTLSAEIKPVEPEQGNSCEGKVTSFFGYSLLSVAFFLFPFFNKLKNKQ